MLRSVKCQMTQQVAGLAQLPCLTHLLFGEMLTTEDIGTELDEGQKHVDMAEEQCLEQPELALYCRPVPLFKASRIEYWYDVAEYD